MRKLVRSLTPFVCPCIWLCFDYFLTSSPDEIAGSERATSTTSYPRFHDQNRELCLSSWASFLQSKTVKFQPSPPRLGDEQPASIKETGLNRGGTKTTPSADPVWISSDVYLYRVLNKYPSFRARPKFRKRSSFLPQYHLTMCLSFQHPRSILLALLLPHHFITEIALLYVRLVYSIVSGPC
jgi:hypothetical protein